MHSFTRSGGRSIFTPNSSRTSALPHWLDTDLLPCFATFRPQPATTNATAVEILKVFETSPPVPQVSIMSSSSPSEIFAAFERITVAAAVISSTVSPFIRSAVINAAIWVGVAAPFIISSNTCAVSSRVKLTSRTTLSIASFIISYPLFSTSKKLLNISFPAFVNIDSG